MPNREAVLRSTTSAVPSPWSCWSLLTSASSDRARSASTRRGAQRLSSRPSGSSRLYWYCVRLTRDALDGPGVLHREEPLRHYHVQHHGEPEGRGRHREGRLLMAEHPAQARAVARDDPVERVLGPSVEPALPLGGRVAEQPGAHHRREGQ